mmetsp:Transcript_31437/g.48067  ORF Transcript_31437/g.48067 Transcript_31437/m.48067 type:complete len:99 (-) Transcript_31437:8302-8598(-)
MVSPKKRKSAVNAESDQVLAMSTDHRMDFNRFGESVSPTIVPKQHHTRDTREDMSQHESMGKSSKRRRLQSAKLSNEKKGGKNIAMSPNKVYAEDDNS